MIYVYAITEGLPRLASLSDLRPMGDARFEVASAENVSAVFSMIDAAPAPGRDTVWQHERVAERLMADHVMLPARFGTVFRDAAALHDVLARNRDALAAGLERVRGCVELGVRVLWEPAPAANPGPSPTASPDGAGDAPGAGRAYLAARATQERQRVESETKAAALAAELNRLLLPAARDGSLRPAAAQPRMMSGAYLVPRDSVTAFRDKVNEAAAAFSELRLLCTGPWPPYHFVPQLSLPNDAVAGVQRG